MRHTCFLYIIFAAVSTLAAPSTSRHDLIKRSTDLSSHTANGIIDEVHPATNAGSDVVLPPVAEVFAMMATASSNPSPLPSTTTLSATTDTVHLGPGLASSPTIERIEILPTTSSTEKADSPHEAPTVAHKFIFVSVVLLSMISLILTIYAFSYHRHQMRINRFSLGESRTFCEEKEKGRSSVVHITRNFPRSKFSVTSSDYPLSDRSSSSCESDSSSEEDSESDNETYERGLMDPAHFFALRSSSMASSRRHSRGGSAPVFGVPRFDGRREQSRRSRSVSGPREEEWL
ncbi:hypothetical protein C8R44DRAFT_781121 [Mycena epipterygia]|nr:hypothetical protein C8R44DRAFT_781121 [Mycena epipterygia]